jgi:hypothetical protein
MYWDTQYPSGTGCTAWCHSLERMSEPAISDEELCSIQARADEATPGPWFVRQLDDDYASSLVAVSTAPDTGRGERWPAFDSGEIIAATLIQNPIPYVSMDDGWDQNAEFIAHARSDIPSLIAEIRRLRRFLMESGVQ